MHLCFQLFLHALQEGQDLAEGIGKTATDQCHHDEKTPFLETPQLDPTKIGFDKSNMENFPYQSYPVLPSAEMMSLQGTFSLCELPFFLVPQLLVDFFQQRLCPKQTSLLHLSAPGKYVYI